MRIHRIADPAGSDLWQELWRVDAVQHPCYLPTEFAAATTHFQPVYYLPAPLRYDRRRDTLSELIPATIVVTDDAGLVAGMPVTVERHVDGNRLSSFGRPLYLLRSGTADEYRTRLATNLIHNHLSELTAEYRTSGYHLRDFLVDGRLSPLSERILTDGGRVSPYFTQVIDLAPSLDDLWLALRGNFRRILRKRGPEMDVRVVTAETVQQRHRDLLHRLHVAMRGREVRSPQYWQAVINSVRAGEGFLVVGVQDGAEIAAASFACSSRYCFYSAAAHDPGQRSIGLSHVLVWRAVEHAKRIGCGYLELGDRVYPGQHSYVADKLQTISHFKAGFGGGAAVRMDVLSRSEDPEDAGSTAEQPETTRWIGK